MIENDKPARLDNFDGVHCTKCGSEVTKKSGSVWDKYRCTCGFTRDYRAGWRDTDDSTLPFVDAREGMAWLLQRGATVVANSGPTKGAVGQLSEDGEYIQWEDHQTFFSDGILWTNIRPSVERVTRRFAVYSRGSATSQDPYATEPGRWTAVNGTVLAHLGLSDIDFARAGGAVLMSFGDACRVRKAGAAVHAGDLRVHTYIGGFDVELPDQEPDVMEPAPMPQANGPADDWPQDDFDRVHCPKCGEKTTRERDTRQAGAKPHAGDWYNYRCVCGFARDYVEQAATNKADPDVAAPGSTDAADRRRYASEEEDGEA